MKQSLLDLDIAFKKFFKKKAGFPKFKSKKRTKPSFYQANKIKFTSTHVKLEKIAENLRHNRKKLNHIKLAEKDRIPMGVKYSNPRISYDGINWYITVGVEVDEIAPVNKTKGIGIDLGIKDLAICSNKEVYPNVNRIKRVKRLEKRKRRLQRSISRKYELNKDGNVYHKTKNIIKSEKELLRIYHRLSNIRKNHLHQTTSEIIKREPSFICIEDLNVKGMLKNRHLSKAIQEQGFGEFRYQIEYKSKLHNIPCILAPRFYPSSKTCSKCGSIKKDLKLSDRVYVCPNCGARIDRDFNASKNLFKYGVNSLKTK